MSGTGMSGSSDMDVKTIRALTKAMRDLGVAEFEYGGLVVKFRVVARAGNPVGLFEEVGEEKKMAVPQELRDSFAAHLEPKPDPKRVAEEYERDLMWSSNG